ncbi:hypothetical protein [Martelella alba]|uniref:Uncharacterized protein n=1 Tax=Martelella alba TaxID=2590451 RepID=A0ABY2SJ26_9HYPH|nr:hypothetical protein [Martelella alba]TKI03964.1 hypothetical protein FCN80_19810 [Martelella alba]
MIDVYGHHRPGRDTLHDASSAASHRRHSAENGMSVRSSACHALAANVPDPGQEKLHVSRMDAQTRYSAPAPAGLINEKTERYNINGHEILLMHLALDSLSRLDGLMPALAAEMETHFQRHDSDAVILMITDTSRNKATLWFSKNNLPGVQRSLSLPGVLCRKDETLPWLVERLTI